jgi:hypothetical protein
MFEIIMRRHNQLLYRVARAILRNDGEAGGQVQSVPMASRQTAAGSLIPIPNSVQNSSLRKRR